MRKVYLLLIVGLLVACQQKPQLSMVMFLEKEQGIEPYQTRIIASAEFIRFDDGAGSQDYVIFDRSKQEIYNINSGSKTIMVLKKKQVDLQSPIKLEHTVNKMGDIKDAPKIKDLTPRHYQYVTNGQVCVDVVSVQGLLPDLLKGLQDYQTVLASDSVVTFGAIPADLHDPCEISMSTFAPTRHLENGFPVQEWKPGYARSLVDFKENFEATDNLFQLPGDYFVYSIQDYREGRVDFENRRVITEQEKTVSKPNP